jgi:ribonuclease P protein component
MLPAGRRLRRPDEFSTTVKAGRHAGRPTLVLHLAEAPIAAAGEPTKVGFIVSRQVGPAVLRNLVKRRLRHLVAARLDTLPAGSRVVVRANPRAGQADFHTLARDLDGALGKLVRTGPDGSRLAPTGPVR